LDLNLWEKLVGSVATPTYEYVPSENAPSFGVAAECVNPDSAALYTVEESFATTFKPVLTLGNSGAVMHDILGVALLKTDVSSTAYKLKIKHTLKQYKTGVADADVDSNEISITVKDPCLTTTIDVAYSDAPKKMTSTFGSYPIF